MKTDENAALKAARRRKKTKSAKKDGGGGRRRRRRMKSSDRANKGDGKNVIELSELVDKLSEEQRREFLSRYDVSSFVKVFEDEEVRDMCVAFARCGFNESEASRVCYVHRNTLRYRLNHVRAATGLDMRVPAEAFTFCVLYELYKKETGV